LVAIIIFFCCEPMQKSGGKSGTALPFLRQHYLDQVQWVFRVLHETLSLASQMTPVGSPMLES
jgi:hypothetical protein